MSEFCNHEGTKKDPCECKMSEFVLSEKILDLGTITTFITGNAIAVKDVKEFIKRYEERLRKLGVHYKEDSKYLNIIGVELAILELRNLAGEDLTK